MSLASITQLPSLIRKSSERREALCAKLCTVGLATVLFSVMMIETSRVAYYLYQLLVVVPVFFIYPEALLKLTKNSFIFRWLILLIVVYFMSLFSGNEPPPADMVLKFLRRILYTIAFLGGIFVAMPILKKHKRRLSYLALAAVSGAAIAIFNFIIESEPRLTYHIGDIHPIDSGMAYGLIGAFVIATLFIDGSKGYFWAVFLTLTLVFSAIMLTSSRACILGMFGMVGIYALCVKDKRALPPVGALLCSLLVYASVPYWLPEDRSSFAEVSRLVSRADAGRFDMWAELIGRMNGWDHLVGKGFLADHTAFELGSAWMHPHSLYIFSYYHGGAIMLIVHVVASMLLAAASVYSLKKTNTCSLYCWSFQYFRP